MFSVSKSLFGLIELLVFYFIFHNLEILEHQLILKGLLLYCVCVLCVCECVCVYHFHLLGFFRLQWCQGHT